jgi:hypothetical protein
MAAVQIKMDNFKKAEEMALNAVKNGFDIRTIAKAHEILSVVSLYNGSTEEALLHLKSAAGADLAQPVYQQKLHELTDKKYSLKKVAFVAARMSCLKKLKTTSKALLAENNFPDTALFFSALETAKQSTLFEKLKRRFTKSACRR